MPRRNDGVDNLTMFASFKNPPTKTRGKMDTPTYQASRGGWYPKLRKSKS